MLLSSSNSLSLRQTLATLLLGIIIGYISCSTFNQTAVVPLIDVTQGVKETRSPECIDWEATNDRFVEDAWYSMKIMPRPSTCKVNGIAIEELEPVHNFRRSYSLGFVSSPEDTYNINQYLLASQDLSLHSRNRRVLLDLGGKTFDTSVTWFLRNYPLDFTEIHVFEAIPGRFEVPPRHNPAQDVADLKPNVCKQFDNAKPIPNWQLARINIHNAFVSASDGKATYLNRTISQVNITRFIKEELKLTAQDTLIVKMDIEGAEWEVLPAWLSDPDMPSIVDELFVEIHYRHPSMDVHNWNTTFMPNGTDTPPRGTASALLTDLRRKGIYAHAWP